VRPSVRRVVLALALVLAAGLVVAVGVVLELKRRRERPRVVVQDSGRLVELLPTADGRSLITLTASPGRLPEVRLLDLEGGAPSRDLEKELDGNLRIAHTPRELALAGGRPGRGVPSVGGLVVHDLRGLGAYPNRVYAFSSDGRGVLLWEGGSSESTVSLWDVAMGKLRGSALLFGIGSAAFSPDGARFVVGARDGEVAVGDVASGKVSRFKREGFQTDQFFVDAEHVLSVEPLLLELWDAMTGKPVKGFEWSGSDANGADLSHDRRFLAIVGNPGGLLRIHDARTLEVVLEHKLFEEIPTLARDESLLSVAFSPEDDVVFVGTDQGRVIRVPVRLPGRP
jgi:hypothetical protein